MPPTFVAFNALQDNSLVEINPDDPNIAALTPTPSEDLPAVVPAGTDIRLSSGTVIRVRGTVAATITALGGGIPGSTLLQTSGGGTAVAAQNGLVDHIHNNGTGDNTVVLVAPGYLIGDGQPGIAVATPLGTAAAEATVVQVDATNFRVRTFDAAGAAVAADFNMIIAPIPA